MQVRDSTGLMILLGKKQGLDFEADLVAKIAAPSKGRRRASRMVWLVPTSLFVVLGAAFTFARADTLPSAFLFSRNSTALSHMARTLVLRLKTADLDGALTVCAEGPEASRILPEEDARIYRDPRPRGGPQAREDNRRARLESLARLRSDLARHGVQWEHVEPVAFAGVCARVKHPRHMTEAVQVATGHAYFASGDSVFAIEVSARRARGAFYIVEFWQWIPVRARPYELKTFAEDRFKEFDRDPGSPDKEVQVSRVRRVYVEL